MRLSRPRSFASLRSLGPLVGAIGIATLGVALGLPGRAQACGGLFCNSAMPVNQAAERIIFSIDKPNKKVTAVVEILYEGPSAKFAWVLPVPGIPTIGVSTSALLDRLQFITNPSYSIARDWSRSCGDGGASRGGFPGAGGSSAGGPVAPSPPPSAEVSVIASGSVGPYDYEVIKVDPTLSDPGMAAINWLTKNAYDVGNLGGDVLRTYLRDGLNLLAFKLSKNKTAGSIRPVLLTYDSLHPMIPIRPTATAANDNMGILVFVLGSTRAVPTNYKTLELNEALIDWFMPNTTYNAVVTQAANEAQGQGFVTELAGTTVMNGLSGQLLQESFIIQDFRQKADGLAPAELIATMVESFASNSVGGFGGPFAARPAGGRVALDGVADVLAANLTLPPGVKVEDVLSSPRCYFSAFRTPGMFYCNGKPAPTQVIDLANFDKVKFLTAVENLVIKPLEVTAKLFVDQPYLTRLYTTLSPAEMTLDPEFDLNNEVGDVSNFHQVTLEYTKGCFGDVGGPWLAKLGGLVVNGEGSTWPIVAASTKMPFNLRVLQLGTTGKGVVTVNNSDTIAMALGSPAAGNGDGGAADAAGSGGGTGGSTGGSGGTTGKGGSGGGVDGSTPGGTKDDSSSGCNCALAAGETHGGPGLMLGLLPLGLVALFSGRRRARARRAPARTSRRS